MKKVIALILSLTFVLALAGCGVNSESVVAAKIDNNVTRIDITHNDCGQPEQWSVEGEEIEVLRNWLDNLRCKQVDFEERQTPGDSNGGESYRFTLMGEDCKQFSYIIGGRNDCYILSDSKWFSVKNPSNPPVSKPTE